MTVFHFSSKKIAQKTKELAFRQHFMEDKQEYEKSIGN